VLAIVNLTTPALLFPAISLPLLAYAHRFVVLTGVIRSLVRREGAGSEALIQRQVSSFRKRLSTIRDMQMFGVASFIFCTASMGALCLQWQTAGEVLFGCSPILLLEPPPAGAD